jgi:putative flavoprotein involved in K+ transport
MNRETKDIDVVVIGGGQSGLAAARAVRAHGLAPLVLEAGPEPVGSWPRYYDSLALFSPAAYSAMPGLPFAAGPDLYPRRDEVLDYLRRYAAGLDVDIRTHTRVTAVDADRPNGFAVHAGDGQLFSTAGVVAASGAFANPYRPELPGQDTFCGRLMHVADYRHPKPYAGQRVVVVGAGNSAVQVAYELAEVASVTLATRHPIAFVPQVIEGRDQHHWLTTSGFDHLPPHWLAHIVPGKLVLDAGDYRAALDDGRMDQRRMFTALDGDRVV